MWYQNQTRTDFEAFYFLPAIWLDVDGMLLAINCQPYLLCEHPSLNGTNIARCGYALNLIHV